MALYIPGHNPSTWYEFDVSESLQLLREYVDGVEQQVNDSIERFRTEKKTEIVQGVTEEALYQIEVHRGLTDDSWNLESIFEDYFPNLQRQGALITLYAFFEYELAKLADMFVRSNSLKVSQTDMSGKGIRRSVLFLEKIVALDINLGTNLWKEIKNIGKVRNQIAHESGNLIDKSGHRIEVASYVDASPLLSGENAIEIQEGYLRHVLDVFNEFFGHIGELIAAQAENRGEEVLP